MPTDLLDVMRLQAAYCYTLDLGFAADFAALFTTDGVFAVTGQEPVVGTAALSEFAARSPRGVHLTGLPHTDKGGQTYTSFTFTSHTPGRLISGYYSDTFERDTAGQLRFSHREVRMTALWATGSS